MEEEKRDAERARGRLSTALITVRLLVLDDGSMLGAVEQPAGWLVETGKAAIDHCESTAVTSVYSCRFTLVQYNHEHATRVECVGRVSSTNGLAGRWRRVAQTEDDDVVMEIPFHMATAAAPPRNEQVQGAEVDTQAPTSLQPSESTRVQSTRPRRRTRELTKKRDMVFRGDTVDAQGEIYETTLFLTFWDEWKVTGVAHESGRECPVVDTWSGCYVQYRLTYPHSMNGTYYYEYEGYIRDDRAGGARFVGTWKFDYEASLHAVHEVLEGAFDFRRDDDAPARNTRSRNHKSDAATTPREDPAQQRLDEERRHHK